MIPLGIFDSGVGGLSVLNAIRQLLPSQPLIYLADQAHVPYGPRPPEEVRSFSISITDFLLSAGAGLVVVACNTASAAALVHLRQVFPDVPFVGMEPAVKPASARSLSKKVGVLATPSTLQGALYASLVARFASGVTIYQDTCPGLVQQIEKGEFASSQTRSILVNALQPMLAQGIDQIVLGCTHYPFVIPLIREIAGNSISIIDPAPAVARQVKRLGEKGGWLSEANQPGFLRIITTGSSQKLARILPALIGMAIPVEKINIK